MLTQKGGRVRLADVGNTKFGGFSHLLRTQINARGVRISQLIHPLEKGATAATDVEDFAPLVNWQQRGELSDKISLLLLEMHPLSRLTRNAGMVGIVILIEGFTVVKHGLSRWQT